MSEMVLEPQEDTLLRILERARGGRLSAGAIRKKLAPASKNGPGAGLDAPEADRAMTGLIEKGLIDLVGGGAKDGPHPRSNASYRLSDRGRDHLRPARPDIPATQLEAQEAFILLQLFRTTDRKLTRSQLNEKLRSRTAVGQLEFDVKEAPETIAYHLASLVDKGCVVEERRGNSVSYHLDAGRGPRSLAGARQHDGVTFTMKGEALNALLEAARGSAPPATAPAREEPPPRRELGARDIEAFLDELGSDRYAGKDLIPIHEVRRLVRERLGAEFAGHPVFDPLLRHLRSEGRLRLLAITDSRDATQEQLDDSIPGMNETLFYIDIR